SAPKLDVDLPAPKLDVDLPAPKLGVDRPAAKLDVDLPAPKLDKAASKLGAPAAHSATPNVELNLAGSAGDDLDIDLPIPKANNPAPGFPSSGTPQGLDLDSPLDRRDAPAAMPKKSFAKPSAANLSAVNPSLGPATSSKPSASAFGLSDELAPR